MKDDERGLDVVTHSGKLAIGKVMEN